MDESEWNFRYAIYSSIVGIVLGLATGALSYWTDPGTPKIDVVGGFLAGLLGSVITIQILQSHELEVIKRQATEAIQLGELARRVGGISATLSRKGHKAGALPVLVRETALTALEAAIDGIDVDKDRYSTYIKGRHLALQTYAHFWSKILEEQARPGMPMIARVTHSSEIDIFYDKYSRTLKSVHSTFARHGCMFRVLIDQQPQSATRISAYLRAIKDMTAINCVYVNVSDHPYLPGDNTNVEFCLIDGRRRYTALWKLRDSKEVKAFILTTEPGRYDECMVKWDALLEFVRLYNYAENPIEREYAPTLDDYRKRFIDIYDGVVAA
jgi:hypothetical protein